MNNTFGVNFICSQCKKSLSLCSCVSKSITAGVSSSSSNAGIYGMCTSCGNLLVNCICQNVYTSSNNCNYCGQPISACICAPIIKPTNPLNPLLNPTVHPGAQTSWTINTSYGGLYLDCRIFDIETKEKLDSCGRFLLQDDDKLQGMYGKISSFELPIEYDCCFHHLRNDHKNLWQIRTPLTFRINLERDEKKEVKFFALITFFDVKNYGDRLVVHEAEFQEVKDNLEVTRLVEIQRVFKKLLRRI